MIIEFLRAGFSRPRLAALLQFALRVIEASERASGSMAERTEGDTSQYLTYTVVRRR